MLEIDRVLDRGVEAENHPLAGLVDLDRAVLCHRDFVALPRHRHRIGEKHAAPDRIAGRGFEYVKYFTRKIIVEDSRLDLLADRLGEDSEPQVLQRLVANGQQLQGEVEVDQAEREREEDDRTRQAIEADAAGA